LVTASDDLHGLRTCSQNRAGSYVADLTSCTRFGSALSKKAQVITVQNQPGSDLDDMVRFWPDVSGLEASRFARIIGPGSGRLQLAHCQFPTFRLSMESAEHIVRNQPVSQLVLADCQVLAEWIWAGSKPVCKNHRGCFWPTLLS